MKKIILFIAAIFCLSTTQAQQIPDSIKMFIPEIDSVCSGSSVYIPIKSLNFRNVIGMQGSIRWDSTILKLDSAFINSSISFFDSLKLDTNINLTKSFISYVLLNPDNNLTTKDSTTIFTLRFKIINNTKISTAVFFSNDPTNFEIDTASDLTGLSDLASLSGNIFLNGKINFIDTPMIIQNGNAFTCIASCIPVMYIWHTYNCSGNLISVDTTFTNAFVSTLPTGTCYSVQCASRYSNGNVINSHFTSNTLPLTFASINARLQTQNSVALNWQTANEINVSHFNISRSNDGINYKVIGKQKANGKSYNEYLFYDSPPVEGLGVVYYRIESVDKDGKKQYSETRTLNLKPQTLNSLSIFPNPTKDVIRIECKGAKEIMIMNYLGKVVYQSSLNRTSYIVNLKSFTRGIYVFKAIMVNGDIKTEKLVLE